MAVGEGDFGGNWGGSIFLENNFGICAYVNMMTPFKKLISMAKLYFWTWCFWEFAVHETGFEQINCVCAFLAHLSWK